MRSIKDLQGMVTDARRKTSNPARVLAEDKNIANRQSISNMENHQSSNDTYNFVRNAPPPQHRMGASSAG